MRARRAGMEQLHRLCRAGALVGLALAVAASLVVGWIRPAPWLLALSLLAILSVLWFLAVGLFLRADAWGEEGSRAD